MSEYLSIQEASKKIIFSYSVDDLQSEANEYLNRKLTEVELFDLKDLIQDSFSDYMLLTFPILFENLKK